MTAPAETMTVTVQDRSADAPWGVGLTDPVTRKITISAFCPLDGQRRGEPRGLNSCDNGAYYWVQVWDEPLRPHRHVRRCHQRGGRDGD